MPHILILKRMCDSEKSSVKMLSLNREILPETLTGLTTSP